MQKVMSESDKIKRLGTIFESEWNYPSLDEPIDVLTCTWPEGDSSLHIASMRGDMEAVLLLVELGLDINAKGDMGQTPLHYAATFGYCEIYNSLVQNGASEDIVNDFGKTPRESKKGFS